MRTEDEVREAVEHIKQALGSRRAKRDMIATALMGALEDAFKWVLEDPTSLFESSILDPCRAADRARKARNN